MERPFENLLGVCEGAKLGELSPIFCTGGGRVKVNFFSEVTMEVNLKQKGDEIFEAHEPRQKAYNSWVALDEEAEVISSCSYDVCYADLWRSDEPVDRLRVYFGAKLHTEKSKGWCNWVIQDSPVKGAFITKTVEEGYEHGFELNTRCDARLTMSGMCLLRHQFEYKWHWHEFVKLGFSPVDSWALAMSWKIKGGALEETIHRQLHSLLSHTHRYDSFLSLHTNADLGEDESYSLNAPSDSRGGMVNWFGGDIGSDLRSNSIARTFEDFEEKPYTAWDGTVEMVRCPKATKRNLELYLTAIGKGK